VGGAASGGASGGVSAGGGTSGGATSGGAGGVSGSPAAGASGMAGNAGSAGASAGPCDVGGKLLCETFDSVAAGALPMGAPWLPLNCFDSTHTLKADGTQHHSGTQSLVGQNIPYADCELRADLGASLSEYWVRVWAFYAQAAPTPSTHEVSVFELVPAGNNASDPGGTDDPSIRVGYRGDTCIPAGIELNITGGGQEETGCTGTQPLKDAWQCYVLHVKQDTSSVTTELSIDDQPQSYMNHGMPQTQITSQVAAVRYLRLGTRSYSGNWANPIYVDDVAVATQAMTCK